MNKKQIENELTPEIIIDAVCEHFLITREQLLEMNGRRFRDYVYPRQLTMYLMKKEFSPKKSLEWIGEYFFLQDHAMVIHACKSVEMLRNERFGDKKYIEHTDKLFAKIERLKNTITHEKKVQSFVLRSSENKTPVKYFNVFA